MLHGVGLNRAIPNRSSGASGGTACQGRLAAEFGARPLKRHVRRTLEKELARAILAGDAWEGTVISAELGEDDRVGAENDARVRHAPAKLAA
jgi:hypothetical protein